MTAEQLAVLCQLHHLTSLYSHRTLSSPHPNPTRYTLSVAWDFGAGVHPLVRWRSSVLHPILQWFLL